MISGNMVGSYSQLGRTFILTDENGNEITGVCVDNPVVFTAGDNDVREGMIYASDSGVSTGNKEILEYRTTAAYRGILPGQTFSIPLSDHNMYDYTKLQCVIVKFNTSFANSVAAEKIVINNGVYNVGSTDKIADVTKNAETQSIELNIINTTEDRYYIHYFTYREEEN